MTRARGVTKTVLFANALQTVGIIAKVSGTAHVLAVIKTDDALPTVVLADDANKGISGG